MQTLSDSNASWWVRGAAIADLGVTIFTDINMLDGEGEAARAAEVGAEIAEKGGGDLAHLAEAACGGGLSFIATTVVATRVGERAIATLKVGEKVWSYNPTTKKMELKAILHVWINHDHDLVDLTITHMTHSKGAKPISEVIHTNQKHPFLTVEKGFLPVGQIKLGMHVVEANGQVGVVSGWKMVPGIKTMYNLEVAQDHTFVVGVGMWVVHNCAKVNPFVSLNDDGLLKSMKSHEALVEEHQQKLSAYIDDPMAQDNQGLLANAPTPEIRQKIYEGRIAQLQKQINRQQNDLQRIQEEAQNRGLLP